MPLEGTKAVEKLTCLRKGVSELHRRPYSKVPRSKDSRRREVSQADTWGRCQSSSVTQGGWP